jgi:hypothetical protein
MGKFDYKSLCKAAQAKKRRGQWGPGNSGEPDREKSPRQRKLLLWRGGSTNDVS